VGVILVVAVVGRHGEPGARWRRWRYACGQGVRRRRSAPSMVGRGAITTTVSSVDHGRGGGGRSEGATVVIGEERAACHQEYRKDGARASATQWQWCL
jgi:hypothetical protein